jgi:endoglucanase
MVNHFIVKPKCIIKGDYSFMKKLIKIIGLALAVLAVLGSALVAFVVSSDQGKLKLPVAHKPFFDSQVTSSFPSMLQTEGNRLVDVQGESVRLRGVMPVDPAKLHAENRFNRRFFEELASTGANVIRIPVHPAYWQDNPDYLWRYLDPSVQWAGELGMYVIIDWHSIGNVETGTAPLMPELYSHTQAMTLDFWKLTAAYFRKTPHVLFEVFNEPQGIRTDRWREKASLLVQTIRAQGASQPVIVGGVDYARSLAWVNEEPVPGDNIVYAAHIYPAHSADMWPAYFGKVAERYPVLITEWGFMDENASAGKSYLNGSASSFGIPLMDFLDERGIGWVACWYDDDWQPPMWVDGNRNLTHFGEFVLAQL